MNINFQTVIDLKPTSRIVLPNGFLLCAGVRLAKPMVKDYYKGELGLDNPTDIIKVYTDADTLFDQAVIDGFDGSDVVISHPDGNKMTADNYKHHIIGTAKNVGQKDGYLVADLTIKDKQAIQLIQNDDIRQISLGYLAQLDMTGGTDERGQAYDARWILMTADHIAVVKQGRCGQDCQIGDSQNNPKEYFMKVTINGIEFEVADAPLAQAILHQSRELDGLKTGEIKVGDTAFSLDENKALQASIDKLINDNKALLSQNQSLKANQISDDEIEKRVRERVKTLDDAKQLDPNFVGDGKTVSQIRREIVSNLGDDKLVTAIVGDVKTANQADIDTAFKALVATSATIVADNALANVNIIQDTPKTFDKSKLWENKQ